MKLRLFILLLLSGTVSLCARAQYSLAETGMTAGAGAVIFSGNGSVFAGPHVRLNGFFSHYTCGKAWGFHFEGGASFSNAKISGIFSGSPGVFSQMLTGANLGAYFKLRTRTYHRPHEFAILAGPKAEFVFLSKATDRNDIDIFQEFPYKPNTFLPMVHFSGWFKNPLGKDHSWFVEPGLEFPFSPVLKSTQSGTGDLMGLRVFLALGVQFWNDH